MRIIGARETLIAPLDIASASAFIESNHRQGIPVLGKNSRAYALLFEGAPVAVAIFCNPRTAGMQRRYTTELLRLAFVKNVRVTGGASKLIKHFMSTGAWDLFTYQDTAGEATNVYEHAGMTLVSARWPKKKVLVRDGLTHAEAKNNRRDWFSLEQAVRRGPDALIGTTLGEVFEKDKRVSNVELFQRSGYHLETIPGDRVYEWRNPNVWFYTYKITSSANEGYYFGRHVIRGEAPTEQDCLSDGYMGSGGLKFQSWIQKVEASTLRKEIKGIYKSWSEVVAAEQKLIGELYLEDNLCLNFQPGGTGITRPLAKVELKICPVHGESKHRGKACGKCHSAKSFSKKICPIHGATTHRKDSCVSCANLKNVSQAVCSIHGLTTHQGASCSRCSNESLITLKLCAEHGLVKHRGDSCCHCQAQALFGYAECAEHGVVIHRGETCVTCENRARFSVRNCSIHGNAIHRGNSCVSCANNRPRVMSHCPAHGETLFYGEKCGKCMNALGNSQRECPVHGMTFHRGEICMKCVAAKSLSTRECPVHGETLFRKDHCLKCLGAEQSGPRSKELCKKHGLTPFNGGSCAKCVAEKVTVMSVCSVHGETLHSFGRCMKCNGARSTSKRECPVHGESFHRGDKCMKCSAALRKSKAR